MQPEQTGAGATLDWEHPAAPFRIDGQVSLDSSDWGFVCSRTGTVASPI